MDPLILLREVGVVLIPMLRRMNVRRMGVSPVCSIVNAVFGTALHTEYHRFYQLVEMQQAMRNVQLACDVTLIGAL